MVIKSRRMRWAGHVASVGGGVAYTGCWWGNLRERDHLGDSGLDGRVILRLSSGSGMRVLDWIEPAQDRDSWRALVNAVMNVRVP